MPRVKHLSATVNYADNQLQIYINSQLALDTGYKDNDPALDQQQSLDSFLKPSGANEILVLGVNGGGPYHFVGSLNAKDAGGNDFEIANWDVGPEGSQAGVVLSKQYQVTT